MKCKVGLNISNLRQNTRSLLGNDNCELEIIYEDIMDDMEHLWCVF